MRLSFLSFLLLALHVPPAVAAFDDSRAVLVAHQDKDLEGRREALEAEKRSLREDEHRLRDLEIRRAQRRLPWWVHLGWNLTHVEDGDHNCGGEQGGISIGRTLLLRAQYAHVSYEEDDDNGDCDGLYWGDAGADERALMAGFMAGPIWFAAGPARVVFDPTATGAWGEDTGTRFELGVTSRLSSGKPVGWEIVLFNTTTDVRNYVGGAINLTFGPRRLATGQTGASGRKGRY